MTLPGFHSPTIGFEQPFEMLAACHERVERTLALFERLVAHVRAQGHDAASRSAAADVLRYFDLAAPHHHQDEERHVLPRLRASGMAEARALADTLEAEHRRMEALWACLREPLRAWREASDGDGPGRDFPLEAERQAWAALYAGHIAAEEGRAYPQARAGIDAQPAAAETLAGIGAEMAARRRAPGAAA
jgi:hemerythrin-like domain-containing protein